MFTAALTAEKEMDALGILKGTLSGFALTVLNSSPDCVKLIDLDGRIIHMNFNGLCAMEIDDFGVVQHCEWPVLWPQEAEAMLKNAMADARDGKTVEFEAYCPTAKNTARWWHVIVAPVHADDGRVASILATSRDITARVDVESQLKQKIKELSQQIGEKDLLLVQRDVLTAEIDHRVKNSFALISSLVRMQMRENPDPEAKEALASVSARIEMLASVHEQLYKSANFEKIDLHTFLTTLMANLAKSIAHGAELKTHQLFEASVDSGFAVSIGFIVTEIVINALKHNEQQSGLKVSIGTAFVAPNYLEVTVRDNGRGLGDDFKFTRSSGTGMKICSIYTQRLKGTLEASNDPQGGAVFKMQFPIS